MDTTLTTSQITSYRQNGYLAIENLLDASELATWRQAIGRAVDNTVSSNDSHHNQRDPANDHQHHHPRQQVFRIDQHHLRRQLLLNSLYHI